VTVTSREGNLPTVSVVIPVRDDATALDQCLRLLARQTLSPLEVVVVDNASSDSSAEVAKLHGARLVFEGAVGIPAAACTGYDTARGDVIARCDADSAPPPDWLARITKRMATDPDVDAITGTGRFYDLPHPVAGLLRWLYLGTFYVSVHAALGHTALWGSNMAFRREAWLEARHRVHRWDAELHDDIDLAFALGLVRRIRFDRGLQVGVSARSLRGRRQLLRRLRRAFRTLAVNWDDVPPWRRWGARLSRSR
jgi:glycosyltransferase involved in cell wall biosynthesis